MSNLIIVSLLDRLLLNHITLHPVNKDILLDKIYIILKSHLFNGVTYDILKIHDLIVKYITLKNNNSSISSSNNNNKSKNELQYFESVYTSFISNSYISNKNNILTLLYKLSKPLDNNNNNTQTNFILQSLPSRSIQLNKSVIKNELEAQSILSSKISIASSVSTSESKNIIPKSKPAILNISNEIVEPRLVRDCLFTFQDAYNVIPNAGVSISNREIIRKICELGWLYKRVHLFLNRDTLAMGLIFQSFCAAMQTELVDYYRLIATLESQVLNALTPDQTDEPGSNKSTLTLKRLYIWCIVPMQRLKLMAMLCDSVANTHGGALISSVETFLHHGNTMISGFVNRLLQTICEPIYSMMQKWMFLGQIDDPFGEFFVSVDVNVQPVLFWQEKFTLKLEMIPTFIGESLAHKVLIIGKSINFLLTCCKDTQWQPSVDLSMNLVYGDDLALQTKIEQVSTIINKRLIHVLMDQYKLKEHAYALKRYLLVGAGDFILHLMELLQVELQRPADKVFAHHLMGFIHQATQASNAHYDDEDITNRITVHLLKKEKLNTGWDIFTLSYNVDLPISIVFNQTCMTNGYHRIFHFLWKLKRVEYLLGRIWKLHLSDNMHYAQTWTKFKAIFSTGYLIRFEMMHFVQNLLNYVMSEVLEKCWDELASSFKSANGLDDILAAHDLYLKQILEKTFMTDKDSQSKIYQLISDIIDLIILFSTHQERLHQTALDDLYRVKKIQDSNKISKKDGKYQLSSAQNESRPEISEPKWTEAEFEAVENIHFRFKESISALFGLLKKYDSSSDISFLISQLVGVNNHYSI